MLSGLIKSTEDRASKSVDGASLACFRIVFGVVGVTSMVRLLAYGWVRSLYADPAHHLRYPGMSWVPTPGAVGMYCLVGAITVASLAIALGWHTRLAAVVFLVLFGWLEFIEVSTYLNHYWFMTLAAGLLIVAPTDTWMAIRPSDRRVAAGWVWLFRFQVGIVYVFAGLAKLQADWLTFHVPLRLWLPARSNLPVVGPLLEHASTAAMFSWAGAIFDCTIVALLLWRRTRPFAWLVLVAFHIATWVLFPIGVFPWLMIGASTIFFGPAWPRQVLARWRPTQPFEPQPAVRRDRRLWWAAGVWGAVMLVIPARSLVISGDSMWTNEGYRFSWNVLLSEKGADLRFRVKDQASGTVTRETGEDLLTPLQWKVMSTDPELIRQTAHLIAARHAALGRTVEVFADSYVSLNGRAATQLIDPTVDLAAEPYRPFGQPWILPAPTTDPPG